MADEKSYEIVHHSRGTRRERTVECEAIDCKNRIRRGEELCADCQRRDDHMRREYALW